MPRDPSAVTIAFRCGQLDALARTLLASPAHYTPEMRQSLALRWLSRTWEQYRQDRAIGLGARLIGAECTGQRNAFLTLLERALPVRERPFTRAIRLVRKIAIRSIAGEAEETTAIVAESMPDLEAVLSALKAPALSGEPFERLISLIDRFRYSRGDEPDALSATARTPCWALNLVAAARGKSFHLVDSPLPFPGLVQRRLFRADRGAGARRADAREILLDALHEAACDIARVPRAAEVFVREFPKQRSNSRLYLAWMLLFGLGALTPAQLGRALPATKAGAAKLLRQLEVCHLARNEGPFEPFACAISLPVAFPGRSYAGPA